MRTDLSSTAVRIIFAAVISLSTHLVQSRWIYILGEKYWERTLIAEMNMSSPTALLYGRRESLIYVDNRVLRYKSDDYSSYEVVMNNVKRPPQILKDKEGNSLLITNFYVLFVHKTDPPTQVVADGNPYFFEVAVDSSAGTAYLVGAENGRFGKLYAFSMFNPIFTNGKLLVKPVDRLNNRFIAISIDKATGDIALIEKDYKTGWRMLLLASDRGGSRTQTSDDVDVSVKRWDEDVVTTSEFRRSIAAALSNMTVEFVSRCAERSDSRVVALSRENRVLRRENIMVRRKLEYLMKTSDLFFEIPERAAFPNVGSDNRLKMEFSTRVDESAKKIFNLLNSKKVLWLDEKDCQMDCKKRCVDGSADTEKKKCGTLPTNSMDGSLPWIATILSSSKFQKEEYYIVCYGTLIHPRVILTFGKNCSELHPEAAIAQVGKFHSDNDGRMVLQERRVTNIIPGSQFTDIRDLTALFLIDEEFDDFNVGVACMSKDRDAGRQNDRCRALTKHYLDDGEATYSVKQFNFLKLKRCAPTTVNLLSGSSEDYYCSGESENSPECKQTASLIVFCPALKHPNNFVMEAVLVKKFLGRCGEIFLDAASGLRWMQKALTEYNITIEI